MFPVASKLALTARVTAWLGLPSKKQPAVNPVPCHLAMRGAYLHHHEPWQSAVLMHHERSLEATDFCPSSMRSPKPLSVGTASTPALSRSCSW
jgi:hypothetical protein